MLTKSYQPSLGVHRERWISSLRSLLITLSQRAGLPSCHKKPELLDRTAECRTGCFQCRENFVHFLYQNPAFDAFDDFGDFVKSISCETSNLVKFVVRAH